MKKYVAMSLLAFSFACGKGVKKEKNYSPSTCHCTHIECPCPNQCENCFCNS